MKKIILAITTMLPLCLFGQDIHLNSGSALVGQNGPTQLLYWSGSHVYYGRKLSGMTGVSSHNFRIDGATKLMIHSSGNVGIGTTNPNSELHVAGDGAVIKLQDNQHEDSENAFHGWIGGYDMSGDEIWWLGEGSSTSKTLGLYTNRTGYDLNIFNSGNGMVIKNGGNIGIGTASPATKLHIVGGESSFPQFRIHESGGLESLDIGHDGSNAILNTNSGNIILQGGNVGIGTTTPQSKLAVEGEIRATRVKVLDDISVPDYVFEDDYELRTLQETKAYIAENKHLPEIPSAEEIGQEGIDLADMNMKLLKKIEELTLYQI